MPSRYGQDAQLKAIVRIWWFGGPWVQGLAKKVGAGHGSVEVHTADDRAYMTWASSGNVPLGSSKSSQSSQSSLSTRTVEDASSRGFSYAMDRNIYGGPPGYEKTLPLRDPRDAFSCGLDGQLMIQWWERAKIDGTLRGYKLLSKEKNCDGITVLALRAGLADCYAPPPTNAIYQGAASLQRWVEQIDAGIRLANQIIRDAINVIQTAEHYLDRQAALTREPIHNRMPTVAEWKQVSAVHFGRRKEQVAAIDKLLGDYHSIQGAGTVATRDRRAALLRMLHQIALHISTKPRSSRRLAIVDLGRRVIKAVQNEHTALNAAVMGTRFQGKVSPLGEHIANFEHAREWHKIPRNPVIFPTVD